MGRAAEGGRRNYQTLRLGIQNLSRRLSIIIGPCAAWAVPAGEAENPHAV